MDKRPKVSVIIATQNNEEHLGECLDSILCGAMRDVEVIIVDVLSTDRTKEIISETADMDDRVVFLTDSYGSIGRAKNVGIAHARAPYIVIVEPEDTIDEHMLEYCYEEMEENKEFDLMTCETDCFGDASAGRTNREKKKSWIEQHHKDRRNGQAASRWFCRQLFEGVGFYRRSYLQARGIRHYEEPGVGKQSAAFSFLTLKEGRFLASAMAVYYRRLDEKQKLIYDVRAVNDICREYRYLREKIQETAGAWRSACSTFWLAYIQSNMELYERLSDELKPVLSKRMQEELKRAINKREVSRDDFEIWRKEDIELLLSSVQGFDEKQREVERERRERREKQRGLEPKGHRMSTEKGEDEERLHKSSAGQKAKNREELLNGSGGLEVQKGKSRINRPWLLKEMSRDLAPLRLLIGLSPEEMGTILGVSGSAYKSLEAGKRQVSWDQYLALLFLFRYNERTAAVTDTLGLYPESLETRLRTGVISGVYD